jgi:hypothetical protein
MGSDERSFWAADHLRFHDNHTDSQGICLSYLDMRARLFPKVPAYQNVLSLFVQRMRKSLQTIATGQITCSLSPAK